MRSMGIVHVRSDDSGGLRCNPMGVALSDSDLVLDNDSAPNRTTAHVPGGDPIVDEALDSDPISQA